MSGQSKKATENRSIDIIIKLNGKFIYIGNDMTELRYHTKCYVCMKTTRQRNNKVT